MNAVLSIDPAAQSSASAIRRLQSEASAVLDACPPGTPAHTYATVLLTVADALDVCRTNGHTVLLRELWRSARQCADRLSSVRTIFSTENHLC